MPPSAPDATFLPPAPEGFSREDWAILATVAYADVFLFAPTAAEIAAGLVGAELDEPEVLARLRASPSLEQRICEAQGFHFLRGSEALVERRLRGARATDALLARHQRTLRWVTGLPFVRMVALSGGTAFKNSIEKEDLDLFLVARTGRAWTAYLFLVATLRLLGTRSVVCANYWVDEANLEIQRGRDLFTASQLAHLVPIYGGDAWRRFVASNQWIADFLPRSIPRPAPRDASAPWKRAAEVALFAVGWPLERAARALLGSRFRRKAGAGSDLHLSAGVLKLHLTDHRVAAMDRWRASLQRLASASASASR